MSHSDRDSAGLELIDPVVEVYKRDVDRSLLRANLAKTIEERIASLVALQRLAAEARRAGRRPSTGP